MAQIPFDNYGQATAVPRPNTMRAPSIDSSAIARGAQAIAGGLGDVANAMARQQAEARQEDEALARAKAANASAELRLRYGALATNEANNLQQGGDYTAAGERFDTAAREIEVPQIAGLSPAGQEAYRGAAEQAKLAARLQVDSFATAAKREDGQRQFGEFLANTEKQGGLPGANVDALVAQAEQAKPLFAQFQLDGSGMDKSVRDLASRMYTTQAASRFNAAGQDVTALEALKHDLEAEDGYFMSRLDPDRRVAMTASVDAQIARVLTAAKVDADKRETVAAGVVKDVVAQAVSGVPPTPDMVAAWQVAVTGTTQEPAFKEALGQVVEVQQVRRMPPAAQQAWIADREAALNTKGGTPQDKTRLATVRAALEADRKQQQDDPLQYLENMTGKPPAAIQFDGLATGNVAAVTTALSDRIASLQALQKQGIPVAMKPLRTAEVTQLTQAMAQMPASRLLELYGPLRAAAGDDAAYGAVMAQIAPGAPLKAYAGELAVRPGGRRAAELVLRGDELLAGKGDKAWKMPPDKDFLDAFLRDSGNAYQGQPEQLQRDLQAARAIYAASASNAGDTDAMTQINMQAFDASMRAARGEIARFGGQQTIAPWGVRADDFEAEAKPQIAAALRAAGLDEDAGGIGLMATDKPGRYVLMQGRSPVWNPAVNRTDGRLMPVFFDFTREVAPTQATRTNPVRGSWKGGGNGL